MTEINGLILVEIIWCLESKHQIYSSNVIVLKRIQKQSPAKLEAERLRR
jgi:hypothetical protein